MGQQSRRDLAIVFRGIGGAQSPPVCRSSARLARAALASGHWRQTGPRPANACAKARASPTRSPSDAGHSRPRHRHDPRRRARSQLGTALDKIAGHLEQNRPRRARAPGATYPLFLRSWARRSARDHDGRRAALRGESSADLGSTSPRRGCARNSQLLTRFWIPLL